MLAANHHKEKRDRLTTFEFCLCISEFQTSRHHKAAVWGRRCHSAWTPSTSSTPSTTSESL